MATNPRYQVLTYNFICGLIWESTKKKQLGIVKN